MKKFIFVLPILLTLPSYADIASGANNATCNSDTIGATEGSTDLEALWSANQYSENPGYYLLYANNTVSTNQTCTAGNYCPGFTNQTFADATMGLNSCAANDANFPNSAAGASAATDCYRACNINNIGTSISSMPHATAISGNDYYGNGIDTCIATACEAGYTATGLPEATGPLTSYTNTNGSSRKYKALNGGNDSSEDTTGLSNGEWEVRWLDGTVVKGTSACTTTSGSNSPITTFASSVFTAGDYGNDGSGKLFCYCMMGSYTLTGSATQSVPSPFWAYLNGRTASECANRCTGDCAYAVEGDLVIREAVFGTLGTTTHACQANVINIDWNPMNGQAHTLNQCTYGGAVTIPEQPSKTGYTFGGWRIKPVTPSEPE